MPVLFDTMVSTLLFLAVLQKPDLPVAARVVEFGGAAHIMNDPEVAGEGVLPLGNNRSLWSPDGTQMAFLSVTPRVQPFERPTKDSKLILSIWSAATRKVTGSFTAPTGHGINQFQWEGPSGSLMVSLSSPEASNNRLFRVLSNGRSTEINVPNEQFTHWRAQTSRAERGALIVVEKVETWEAPLEYQLYYLPEGLAQPVRVQIPPDRRSPPYIDDYFRLSTISPNKQRQDFKFIRSTASFVPTDEEMQFDDSPTLPAVDSGEGMAAIQGDRKHLATFGSWWLVGDDKSKYPLALVSPKAQYAELSAKTLNVAYVDAGNLFVRRIKKITQDQVEDLLECEERVRLLSDVKQVGTAVMIFMSDNDDFFPVAAGFRDKIYPYVKNNALLDGFVYSYRGPQNAVEVDEPSKTELGYKDGQFGRAVVRADSSAIWESRRKKPNKEGC